MLLLLCASTAAAGEVATTPTPTATAEPTRSVRPIEIRCEIAVTPPHPGLGDTVIVDVYRYSNGLGYPGPDAYTLRAWPLFEEISPAAAYGRFTLRAVAQGTITLMGSVMDEFVVGYYGNSPTYQFSNAFCETSVAVGAPVSPTATQPSPTATATLRPPTPTFTPTSCVSDLPSVEQDSNKVTSLRRLLYGFNRGLFCFRGGDILVRGAQTDAVNVDCGTANYTAAVTLTAADTATEVTVCHYPGGCGSIGCRTVELRHRSARTFRVDTTVDDVDQSPGDGVCATGAGHCSLRAAVEEANTYSEGTTSIVLEGRTYTVALNTGDDESAASGDLDVTAEISIRGAATTSVITAAQSGLPTASQRVFEIHAGGVLLLSDVTIQGGRGWQGGAVGNSGNVTLRRVTLTGNVAAGAGGTGGFGGGLWNDGQADLVEVAVEGNIADALEGVGASSGGGLWNNGVMRVVRSSISGNAATVGGGIFNGGGILDLENVTVSGNSACCQGVDSRGGGIMNDNGSVRLHQVTVAENIAVGAGAGLYGSAWIRQSILSANPPFVPLEFSDNCDAAAGPITSGGFNLDSNGSCGLDGEGDQTGEALLRPLRSNGGMTRTHALAPDSLAIDAGGEGECLATDQRGVTRPLDGNADGTARCDVGAFEYRGPADAACLGDCNSDGNVLINEVVLGVNIALNRNSMDECGAIDGDGDGVAAVHELVGAVERLLRGCIALE